MALILSQAKRSVILLPAGPGGVDHFAIRRTSREPTGNARMIPFYGNPEYAYTPPRSQHDTVPEKTAWP